ncbi:frataxin, mitochondrial-like [Paramacrobiotus metropolitanus]|uniref:frataxin, mitochondrial-like n=1 Tax=Paramacrobiotus metropolitanus TaxID=2943436 RepID=UPI0024462C6C|nr:frataxin, mitochondrial-like [Paramacrobiotus metropolitanus]
MLTSLRKLIIIQRRYYLYHSHNELFIHYWKTFVPGNTGWYIFSAHAVARFCSHGSLVNCFSRSGKSSGSLFSSFTGAPKTPGSGSTEMTEKMYNEIADHSLDELTALFEEIGDTQQCHPEYDVTLANGVLTVKIQPGETYVINKQSPNRQIWLSSPLSGPKRYDYARGTWIYLHDGMSLYDLLSSEISSAIGAPIDFSRCRPGGASSS